MTKDLKNVTASFSLVIGLAVGGAWLYTQEASAEQAAIKQQAEYDQKELLAQQSMQLLLLAKSIEASASSIEEEPTSVKKPTKVTRVAVSKPDPIPTTIVSQSASALESQIQAEAQAAAQREAEAKAKRDADALAKQIADAKAAAKKEADKAAQLAAKEASRKSSAS